ncbi:MAG: SAF domain-containing protein, partial [Eubacteriales bacterium]|nr:SAF domain-containing protein [Eubacteriales bacterium]
CGCLKRMRSILGLLLILLSIAALFLWEWKGRHAILLQEVLVATEEIQMGAAVNSSMFQTKGVLKENIVHEALTREQANLLQGKIALQMIPKNDQIIMDYFGDNSFSLKEDESIFVISQEWIAMRSSALRRGDMVDIYGNNGIGFLGTYQIAFVKDESEREVKDAGKGEQKEAVSDILQRTDSTSFIDHIEIITTFSEYEKIAACIGSTTPCALIIVQRGNSIDT